MDQQIIIEKLKELKKIQPSSQWRRGTREYLLSQVKTVTRSGEEVGFFGTFMKVWQSKFSWRMASILTLILILISGSSLAVHAARQSLPGDKLYPVKIALRNVKKAFAFTLDRRVEMEVSLISERTRELQQLANKRTKSRES